MSVRLSTEQGLEREVGGSKLAIRTAYWPAFNIPSIPFQSTGFLWIHNSLNFWFGLVFNHCHCAILKALGLCTVSVYRMLKLRLGELRCEKLSDRRRFAYFQGDFMATTEVNLALVGLPSGWCRVFIAAFVIRYHTVSTFFHVKSTSSICPEGFATDATSLQQPPRSAAKRRCLCEDTAWVPTISMRYPENYDFTRLQAFFTRLCCKSYWKHWVAFCCHIRWGGLLWLLAED